MQELSVGVRCYVAKNPSTPPETLTVLSQGKDWVIRRNVAWNPNTHLENLVALGQDKVDSVRREVAENPNTPYGLWIQTGKNYGRVIP